jgi:hypothetical protein
MLRGGVKKTPLWPKVPEPKSEVRPTTRDSDGSDEERSIAPVYRNSFGEAIQAALDNLESGKGDYEIRVSDSHHQCFFCLFVLFCFFVVVQLDHGSIAFQSVFS